MMLKGFRSGFCHLLRKVFYQENFLAGNLNLVQFALGKAPANRYAGVTIGICLQLPPLSRKRLRGIDLAQRGSEGNQLQGEQKEKGRD